MSKINKAGNQHLWLCLKLMDISKQIASGLLDSNYMELFWQLQNLITVVSLFLLQNN